MGQSFSFLKNEWRLGLIFSLFIVTIVVWVAVAHEDRSDLLKFVALDIGQGDSLFIESPTGMQVLIDGGPDKNLMREISKVMPWYDRHIDMLVVTNPDKDHYEGFIPLLDKYKTDVVLEAGTFSETGTYKTLEEKIKNKNIPKVIALRGQIIDLGGGAYLQILFPDRDVSGLSSNNGSIVMKLMYGETSVLLQGDSTSAIEKYLIGLEGENLKSTILKVGHHGSRTSTSEEYVKNVKPKYALISAAKDNSYGHPHPEVISILNKSRVEIFGTYERERIIFESDGKNFSYKK